MDEVRAGGGQQPGSSPEDHWSPVRERSTWERVRHSLWLAKLAIFGIVILVALIFLAVTAPVLSPHDPNEIVLDAKFTPPVWQNEGDWSYPLGTDKLGRDILSRLIYGVRISLVVGFGTVALGGFIGISLGLVSGYYGGWVDDGITLVAEIQLAFPSILLALVIMTVLGPGLRNVILVLSIAGWVIYSRVVRAEVFATKELTYVEAARVIGVSDLKLLYRHILPNVAASATVIASFAVASAIMAEAFLSFLGLGVGPEIPTWGGMLADGRDVIREAWWLATFPGLAIMVTVLGINVVGDWLRDFLDPRMRS